MKRAIIHIDEEKCNGCGLCIPSCAEGALQIVNGKAKLIADNLCDGLGACLGDCPQGALIIEERDSDAFDEEAVEQFLAAQKEQTPPTSTPFIGCPGSRTRVLNTPAPTETAVEGEEIPSALGHWPVQLNLVNPIAPYFKEADLLIAADCVPFAYADFHRQFLRGHALVIGCPKLDDAPLYVQKLTALIRSNNLKSITIVVMEVPCCGGLHGIIREAMRRAECTVPVEVVQVSVDGKINFRSK
ncbi:MAG TPA: 4Fe-4S binding protein [Oscillospiraceae bacterium]|nr:4Fe-4S binding protein [Oscillospiraceae bacterium]